MFAAAVTPMEFLIRFHGFMSRNDAGENLQRLVRKESIVTSKYEHIDYDPFQIIGDPAGGIRVIRVSHTVADIPVLVLNCISDGEGEFKLLLYLDDKLQFRIFTPIVGNTFNRDTMSAFGIDLTADTKFVCGDFPYTHSLKTVCLAASESNQPEHLGSDFATDITPVVLKSVPETLGA